MLNDIIQQNETAINVNKDPLEQIRITGCNLHYGSDIRTTGREVGGGGGVGSDRSHRDLYLPIMTYGRRPQGHKVAAISIHVSKALDR